MTDYCIRDSSGKYVMRLFKIDSIKRLEHNRIGFKNNNVCGYVAIIHLDRMSIDEEA